MTSEQIIVVNLSGRGDKDVNTVAEERSGVAISLRNSYDKSERRPLE